MTVINPSSISGITSITLPSGGDNVLTIHTNDGTERFRIDSSGNVKVGSACTISQDGDVFFTGVCTATTLTGAASGLTGTLPAISGANLTNLPAANLTGALPAISGANLTGIAATDNVRTGILDVAGIATFRSDVNIPNINGGQIGGRRNLIINGAMEVAQRGTSETGVAANGFSTVDRFAMYQAGTDDYPETSQSDVASGTTPYTNGFRKAYKITNGNQSSGGQAADELYLSYKVESQDMAQSGWNYTSTSSFVTLSFWVKSSVAQNFYAYLKTADGTSQHYPFETGSLSANTWTKITKTIPGNSNIQFDTDTNANRIAMGVEFVIGLFFGTDKTGSVTLDQWGTWSSSTRSPDYGSSNDDWYETNDATFELTGVQLEVGSQATSFEHRSYNEEVKLCERYFQTSFERGVKPAYGLEKCVYNNGRPYSSSYVSGFGCDYRTEMRSTPSVTLYTSTNGASSTLNEASGYNGSAWVNYTSSLNDSCNTKQLSFAGNWHSGITLYQFNYKAESEL